MIKIDYGFYPAFNIINPLKQANYRAVSMATFWDQPPQKNYQPLKGQIFITLLDSQITKQTLKPAKIEDKPSFKMIRNHLAVGLVCENDQWKKPSMVMELKEKSLIATLKGITIN